MISYQEILNSTTSLSVNEKIRLIEHLSTALREELEVEAYKKMPWEEFIARTAGSLEDDPIERPAQPDYEDREPLE